MKVRFGDKLWDKDAVHALLDGSDAAVARALMVVYSNQTADEREIQETRHHNGVGFTGRDARFLTDVAQKWQRYGRWASQRQADAVRRAMKKYWRQLLEEIAAKPGAEIVKGRVARPEKAVSDDCGESLVQPALALGEGYGAFS